MLLVCVAAIIEHWSVEVVPLNTSVEVVSLNTSVEGCVIEHWSMEGCVIEHWSVEVVSLNTGVWRLCH